MAEDHQEPGASAPPSCPDCARTMRLVGSEDDASAGAELLTFACDCGQIATRTTSR